MAWQLRLVSRVDDPVLPADLRRLIDDHITSVEQMAILAFLYHHRPNEWSAAEISTRCRTSTAAVGAHLDRLTGSGFVRESPTVPPAFAGVPRSPAQALQVAVLIEFYEARQVDVLAAICARPIPLPLRRR